MKSIILFFFIFTIFASFSTCNATIVADFENGINTNLSTGSGYEWCPEWGVGAFSSNNSFSTDSTTRKEGSHSLKINCSGTNMSAWMYDLDLSNWRYMTETHNAGFDRMSFYILLPSGYPLAPGAGNEGYGYTNDYNFNVGTYTIYPSTAEPLPSHDNSGWAGTQYINQIWNHPHYYHLFNIPGSDHWTKLVMNAHPDVESDRDNYDPGANPTEIAPVQGDRPGLWNYYDGFTRIYYQLVPYAAPPSIAAALPYDVWLDDIQVYAAPEEENDTNISQIAATYMGDGQFILTWRGNHFYATENPSSTSPDSYEVYWATAPLSNANYAIAGTKLAGTFTRSTGWAVYSSINTGIFNTNITSGTVYFAIKDISDGSTAISKIDYEISEAPSDTTPPESPTGLSIIGLLDL